MEMETQTRRIGSFSFGITLVTIGVLFLLHSFVPVVSYAIILRLWPAIFIMLGIEILIGTHKNIEKFVYDKTAIFLTIILMGFSMFMGLLQYAAEVSYFRFS